MPLPGYSIDISKNNIRARTVYVRGGVEKKDLKGFKNFTKSKSSPLRANQRRVLADPLATLPVPSLSNAPSIPSSQWTMATKDKPKIKINNKDDKWIDPGIYADIDVNPGGVLRLRPGVYIISPNSNNQGFRIDGSVYGDGVMIYLTGDNFTTNTKGDYLDGAASSTVTSPLDTSCSRTLASTSESNINYAILDISPKDERNRVVLTGITDSSSPFHNILIFQRRRSTKALTISPDEESECQLNGVIYAKWAPFIVDGKGELDITYPMVVGRFEIRKEGELNLKTRDLGWRTSIIPYLVE